MINLKMKRKMIHLHHHIATDGNNATDATLSSPTKSLPNEENENDDESHKDSDSECNITYNSDSREVPDDYLFPSFFVFVPYGPFVPPSERLDINLIDNGGKKKGEATRSEMREKEAKEKAEDATNDKNVARGFTNNQRIDIETLGL